MFKAIYSFMGIVSRVQRLNLWAFDQVVSLNLAFLLGVNVRCILRWFEPLKLDFVDLRKFCCFFLNGIDSQGHAISVLLDQQSNIDSCQEVQLA